MTGSIYIMKNFANGKLYIGQTILEVRTRYNTHMQEAFNKNKPEYDFCLSRGIRKYGREAFDVAVLAENVPKDKLDLVEAHYINMYNTTDPKIGYNMSPGFRDTSNHQYYEDLKPDEDYEESNFFDNITEEEIDAFLEEL